MVLAARAGDWRAHLDRTTPSFDDRIARGSAAGHRTVRPAGATGFIRDFRHACRTLVRRPATSAVIVVTLALALATNSTSFAVLDAIVLRPFRFPGVDRLVMVASSDPQDGLFDRESVSPADFRDWRRETRTLDALVGGGVVGCQPLGHRTARAGPRIPGHRRFLRRPWACAGRTGGTSSPRKKRPATIAASCSGHALWTRLFAADPPIVGRTVRVDGEPFEVVGVAPDGFAIPDGAQVWSPLAYTSEEWANRRECLSQSPRTFARRLSLADARAEFAAFADRLRREFPDTNGSCPPPS